MFNNLMILLSDRFHLIAPDYPVSVSARFPLKTVSSTPSKTSRRTCIALPKRSVCGLFPLPARLRVPHRAADVCGPPGKDRTDHYPGRQCLYGSNRPAMGRNPGVLGTSYRREKEEGGCLLSEEGTKAQYTADCRKNCRQNRSRSLDAQLGTHAPPGNVDMQFALNCDYKTTWRCSPCFRSIRTRNRLTLVIWGQTRRVFRREGSFLLPKRICPMRRFMFSMADTRRWKPILTKSEPVGNLCLQSNNRSPCKAFVANAPYWSD